MSNLSRFARVALLVLLCSALIAPAIQAQRSSGPTPVERGRMLYKLHCSGCHGREAHGDGPVAEHLRIDPSDLTLLAHEASGRFPRERIFQIIDGRQDVPTHGTRAMPVWGLSLYEPGLDQQREEDVSESIWDIVDFLKTLQEP